MAKVKSVDVVIDPEGKWNFRRKRSSYIPHDRVTQDDDGELLTRQEFRDECDVNVLMRKYEQSGFLPQSGGTPQFGDFADLPDFMTAQNTIRVANEAFAMLPARVRAEFDNDPAAFVEFASNPENIEDMRRWGLAPPAAAERAASAPPPADALPEGGTTP